MVIYFIYEISIIFDLKLMETDLSIFTKSIKSDLRLALFEKNSRDFEIGQNLDGRKWDYFSKKRETKIVFY